ncbi:MAG: hypothetical protein HC772_12465 [Leptolyngbyaceae cyanobacterium CRU_2_3]|nr:hypothetical protein [Leptolyngbyaceae cyanobacterium CRU_2_3]
MCHPSDFSDLLFDPVTSEDLVLDDFEEEDLSGLLTNTEQFIRRSDLSTELNEPNELPFSFDALQDDDFEAALFASAPERLTVTEESLFDSDSSSSRTSNSFENLDDLLAGLVADGLTVEPPPKSTEPNELSELDAVFGNAAFEDVLGEDVLGEDVLGEDILELSDASEIVTFEDALELSDTSEIVATDLSPESEISEIDTVEVLPGTSLELSQDRSWDSSDLVVDLWDEDVSAIAPSLSEPFLEDVENQKEN